MTNLYINVDLNYVKGFLDKYSKYYILQIWLGIFGSFGQPDFVRWLMSDGFERQSKRALREINQCADN